MEAQSVLIGSSVALTLVLFLIFIMLITRKNGSSNKKKKKVSSDLQKIKDQINGE